MATIFVDSSVWIDYFNGAPTAEADTLDRLLGSEPLVIGDLVLAEVLQGFRRQRDWRRARQALLRFPVLPLGGVPLALRAAEHYRTLRAEGVTVRTMVDCLIATFCIEHGLELLQRDRDFPPFAEHLGLALVEPDPAERG